MRLVIPVAAIGAVMSIVVTAFAGEGPYRSAAPSGDTRHSDRNGPVIRPPALIPLPAVSLTRSPLLSQVRQNGTPLNSCVGRIDGYRGVALAPIVAIPGEQPHHVALAPDLQAIAVVLDFVDPVPASRRLDGARRDTWGNKGGGHVGM